MEWIPSIVTLVIVIGGLIVTVKAVNKGFNASVKVSNRQSAANTLFHARQAWIDNLRRNAAEFLSIYQYLTSFWSQQEHPEENKNQAIRKEAEMRVRWFCLLNEAEMQLNPEEEDHCTLIEKLRSLQIQDSDFEQRKSKMRDIIKLAQRIFKDEWEVAKRELKNQTLPEH